METIGQARLLASNKVIDRVKEDLIKTWPRSALLGCAADGFNEGVTYERRKAIEAYKKSCDFNAPGCCGCKNSKRECDCEQLKDFIAELDNN
jgi:hypothetical protein